ncbi:helix-turn-helix domain-containing protein [Gluconobacter frateurii]|uniref:IclR family transcriptional regulator n=1 Tax=Gluconobacter frateurii TaxID=38308 RepID=UPI001F064485|nr:IclR family transcriptional regulator C-terminal domain-containing protein [Gluconobacter frateurii]UMM08120.1 helix-turn-helix domain-containing protein [Gluconobacter frateurii]
MVAPVLLTQENTSREKVSAAASQAQYSQNSDRAAQLLIVLNSCGPEGLALGKLAEMVDAEKSAVHRSLLALRRHGLVSQAAQRGRYRLGPAALALGRRRINPVERIRQWKSSLASLGREFKASAFLLERSGLDAIITDMYITDSRLPVLGHDGLGGRLPLGYGMGSTVILANQDPDNQLAILCANEPRYQELNMDVAALRELLGRVRDAGYDFRRNAVLHGMSGISLPIWEGDGTCCAAVTVSKPTEALSDREAGKIVEKIASYIELLA